MPRELTPEERQGLINTVDQLTPPQPSSLLQSLSAPQNEEYIRRAMLQGSQPVTPSAGTGARRKMPISPKQLKARMDAAKQKENDQISQWWNELLTQDLIISPVVPAPSNTPGIMPFGAIPGKYVESVKVPGGFPVGWDLKKLSPEKQLLLRQVEILGRESRQKAK